MIIMLSLYFLGWSSIIDWWK